MAVVVGIIPIVEGTERKRTPGEKVVTSDRGRRRRRRRRRPGAFVVVVESVAYKEDNSFQKLFFRSDLWLGSDSML